MKPRNTGLTATYLILMTIGFGVLLLWADWPIAVGVFFVLWGSNIEQRVLTDERLADLDDDFQAYLDKKSRQDRTVLYTKPEFTPRSTADLEKWFKENSAETCFGDDAAGSVVSIRKVTADAVGQRSVDKGEGQLRRRKDD